MRLHTVLLVTFAILLSSCCLVQGRHQIEDGEQELGTPRAVLHSLQAFHGFMETHNKTYSSRKEYKHRYNVFKKNMKRVKLLQDTEQGTAVYGATHLADLTPEEFKKNYLGFTRLGDDPPEIHWPPADIPDVELPESFDWRDHGAVTKVKNQGMCGSCWAFSVSGNVEGQQAVRNGKLISLSEQELVDCDPLDGGCGGGFMENAYKTLLNIGGLESESDYGYDGDDEACRFNRSKVAVRVTGGVEIDKDEHKMAQWLLKNGPISVALNAFAMQFYMGGVTYTLHKYLITMSPLFIGEPSILVPVQSQWTGPWSSHCRLRSPHYKVPTQSPTLLDHQELLGTALGRTGILQAVQRCRSVWYQHDGIICYGGGDHNYYIHHYYYQHNYNNYNYHNYYYYYYFYYYYNHHYDHFHYYYASCITKYSIR